MFVRETQSTPFPDFSLNHQCRDYEKVREWRDESAVDWDMWVDMVKPKGVKQVPAPDEYYELWGTPKPGEEGESLIHGHH